MSTLTRAETPTQSPSGELYLAGVRARVGASTLASRPLPCRYSRAGEFSVQMTSAGEADPSVTIWSASTSSSSLRTLTVIPVARSNPEIIDSAVCTCWPLYSVIDRSDPDVGDPPQAARAPAAMIPAAATAHRYTPGPAAMRRDPGPRPAPPPRRIVPARQFPGTHGYRRRIHASRRTGPQRDRGRAPQRRGRYRTSGPVVKLSGTSIS